jgi:DNA oxidative demethylase
MPGGITVLRGFAREKPLLAFITRTAAQAPFRHMPTPGGRRMSVAMSSAGPLGWVSNERGYRYSASDPDSGRPWPALPRSVLRLAADAACTAGFAHFRPDSCLINRYEPGARMGSHRDQDERDLSQPIVSVSLGLPAVFVFHGLRRSDRLLELELHTGDVVVFGGPARLYYHSVKRVAGPPGSVRYNLTLRRAA